ncbi:MAG TPA: cytochrome c, partial [Verrucomicrobiaceae bacterium]
MNDPAAPIPPGPAPAKRRGPWFILALLLLVCFGGGALIQFLKHGGLTARQKPTAIESFVAHGLVDWSIPAEAKALKNPVQATAATLEAGRALYQKSCEVCHGYDGNGRTAAGGGMFPSPAVLGGGGDIRRKRSDGELFYFIRNGIRNTAMPGWQLPDQEIWQLVSYIRHLPLTAPAEARPDISRIGAAHYVGSASCVE